MLKISEMAKLANTTRRTLIFYDEQDLFHPIERSSSGYRYYKYEQLYELLFILSMKDMGLSLNQIKEIQNDSSSKIIDELINIQEAVDSKITELSKVESIVSRKILEETKISELVIENYQPVIVKRPRLTFWCSREAVSCTEEEIAELFSEFYQQLDKLALMDGNQSGFLADVPNMDSKEYPEATFRVIKETATNNSGKAMPKIEKIAGEYVAVKVENSTMGVCRGLDLLKVFCGNHKLNVTDDMWQINEKDDLTNKGGSDYLWLEYLIKK